MSLPANEFLLENPPADGISCVRFAEHSNHLLVASWDAKVRFYDVGANVLRKSYAHGAAVLDACFGVNEQTVFSGGLDCTVKSCELDSMTERVLGTHSEAVRCMSFSSEHGLLVTGSWDSSIKLWDPSAARPEVRTVQLPHKAYAMDLCDNLLVVAMGMREVHIYDLRHVQQPQQRRESSLKYQTRAVKCMTDKQGYVLSSVEGRVAVEFFDASPEIQAKKYAFKCHRANVDGVDMVYPVNAFAFHPGYGTFATGGCDGMVYLWDGVHKKRLCQFHKYPTSIAALDFNHDGSLLAVAASYTFENGQVQHPADQIYIRTIADAEVMPKPRGVTASAAPASAAPPATAASTS